MKYQFNVRSETEGCAHHIDYRVKARQGVMSTASRVIALRPDLLLNISAVRPGIEAKFKFEIGNAPVQFGFIVSGANRCTYYDGALKSQTHSLIKGATVFIIFLKHRVLLKVIMAPECLL
jgi:hypothetical protein